MCAVTHIHIKLENYVVCGTSVIYMCAVCVCVCVCVSVQPFSVLKKNPDYTQRTNTDTHVHRSLTARTCTSVLSCVWNQCNILYMCAVTYIHTYVHIK